jgi:selenide,water dikinase
MAASSDGSLEIVGGQVPLLEGARGLVRGNIPGGGRTNRHHFEGGVRIDAGVDPALVDLLYDPQTSGGLLVAVDPARVDALFAALVAQGVPVARIGRVLPRTEAAISVIA